MPKRWPWWLTFDWGVQNRAPYVWVGPILISWFPPYGGYREDVQNGMASRFYWPRDFRIDFYPIAD